jgi:predicted GIY-YIG superfamily endonuclease
MTKTCRKCGETKALKFFYRAKFGKLGRASTCKECCKIFWARPARENGRERKNINRYRFKLTPGVYFIKATNGTYVGQSKEIEARVIQHRPWNDRSPVEEVLSYEILEIVKDKTEREEREKFWIDKLKPTLNRYNP